MDYLTMLIHLSRAQSDHWQDNILSSPYSPALLWTGVATIPFTAAILAAQGEPSFLASLASLLIGCYALANAALAAWRRSKVGAESTVDGIAEEQRLMNLKIEEHHSYVVKKLVDSETRHEELHYLVLTLTKELRALHRQPPTVVPDPDQPNRKAS